MPTLPRTQVKTIRGLARVADQRRQLADPQSMQPTARLPPKLDLSSKPNVWQFQTPSNFKRLAISNACQLKVTIHH